MNDALPVDPEDDSSCSNAQMPRLPADLELSLAVNPVGVDGIVPLALSPTTTIHMSPGALAVTDGALPEVVLIPELNPGVPSRAEAPEY